MMDGRTRLVEVLGYMSLAAGAVMILSSVAFFRVVSRPRGPSSL
jgi:hypothetical protein